MLSDLRVRLRALFTRRAVESELDDELRFHLERELEKHLQAGMSRDDALRQVRLAFGGIEQVKDACRDARGVSLLETLTQDLRYGWRTLRTSPSFTAAVLCTLALGIGATTAIFSVVYGIVLRPLPFRDASGLIVLHETTPKVGIVSVSYPNFQDWRAHSQTFSEMAAVTTVQFNMTGIGQPENIAGLAVSPNFLSMMGVRPVLGRGFTKQEERLGTASVVLLSYALWQSHFGGDEGVIGRTIQLDSRTAAIIGVLPADFRWVEHCDVMEPIGVWATNNDAAAERGNRGDLLVAGRLATGRRIEEARTELAAIAARLARTYPQTNDQFGVTLQPLAEVFSGDVRPTMWLLLGAAMCVLLVASANVANLFLMRGAVRAREMALRVAIGASRSRIVRQMLTESFMVALLGGLAGVGLALVGIPAIVRALPAGALAGAHVDVNGVVLLFSAALVIVSMVVSGLVPALHATSGDVQSDLKQGGKAASARTGNRWRARLAIGEIAVALILLVGAGLMMKSLYRLLSVDPGFRAERVLKLEMSLQTEAYRTDAAVIGFWQRALERVRALPAVQSAAVGTAIPLTGQHARLDITVEGMSLPKPGSFPHPDLHVVSRDYEKALGIRLMMGRGFTDQDVEDAPRVAMVNATLAQRLFPGEAPVGKRFMFGHPEADRAPRWLTVVGVLADTRLYGLADPARLEIYVPYRQLPESQMALLVQSTAEPAALVSTIRGIVASIDNEQPVFQIASMQDVVNASVSTRRLTFMLLGVFSGLALALAAIGIYGVIAYSVAQREKEIGIQMALGASPGDVLRVILAQGGRITISGVVIGTIAASGLAQVMAKLLYAVSPVDPATFITVALGLALIAMTACYIPARRALGVSPLIALRHE
jgi:putative ABC transport system permease protein